MSRISSYVNATPVVDADKWIGTDSVNQDQTKNFTAESVAKYIRINGRVAVAGQLIYQYVRVPNISLGSFSLLGGGLDIEPFNTITQLNISEQDKTPQNVVSFLDYLVDSDILIGEQNDITNFGHYKVTAYTIDPNNNSFYNLSLTYLGGNGSIENEKYYDIVNFTLAETVGDKSYIFTQANPNTVWTINHNLDKFPSVSVVDTSNTMVEGLTEYTNTNTLTITFTAGFAGKAYLN
jgi:hypothetical protein